MKVKTVNYGGYEASVSKDSKKTTVLINKNGRASDSLYDVPLPLMKLISDFIFPNFEEKKPDFSRFSALAEKWLSVKPDPESDGLSDAPEWVRLTNRHGRELLTTVREQEAKMH